MKMLRKSIIVCMLFFAGMAQGMDYEKYDRKHCKENFGFSDFRLEVANAEPSKYKKTAKSGLKEINSFSFTCHALKKMAERQVNQKDVSWVIRHGNRYCDPHGSFNPRQLVVDTQMKIGVVIKENKKVLTVLINMDQAAVDKKLSKWNKAKKSKFASKKTREDNNDTPIEGQASVDKMPTSTSFNNSWEYIRETLKVGQRIRGTVDNITDFGVFIKIACGFNGLVYRSDISPQLKETTNLSDVYKRGDQVEVTILKVDQDKKRVSLGIK